MLMAVRRKTGSAALAIINNLPDALANAVPGQALAPV
jgi:hypothetical protein